MAERDYSGLLKGGDFMGMTNEQYKGMLIDHLDDLNRILELAIENGDTKVQKEVEKQIKKTNEKLKF